jgi:hypothetical protein
MNRKTLLVGTLIAGALGVAQVLAEFDPAAIADIKRATAALEAALEG